MRALLIVGVSYDKSFSLDCPSSYTRTCIHIQIQNTHTLAHINLKGFSFLQIHGREN